MNLKQILFFLAVSASLISISQPSWTFDCNLEGWGEQNLVTNGVFSHEDGNAIVEINPSLDFARFPAPNGMTFNAEVNKYVHINMTLDGVDITGEGLLCTVNHMNENNAANSALGFRVFEGNQTYTIDFSNHGPWEGTRRISRLHLPHWETIAPQVAVGFIKDDAVFKINWIVVSDDPTPPSIPDNTTSADTDSDGINDDCDQCANTPSNEETNLAGCSSSQLDDDNDGVTNNIDACPGSLIGESVDANGCTNSQLDGDGDGVIDTEDSCLNTPIGESADGNGCAPSQKDEDGDLIPDAFDQCPNTPEGVLVSADGCEDTERNAPNLYETDTRLGAIRWDAWVGSESFVGVQVETTLSPNEYHFRVPFFGEVINENEVKINGTTQAIMNQEITYASYAGLDYWAFLWYPSDHGLDQGRKLYKTSSLKHFIDYCLVVEPTRLGTQVSIDEVVEEFADPSYVKVLTDRPLLYFFGTNTLTHEDINEIRSKSISAGTGDPYIVLMRQGEGFNIIQDLNLDALTRYATTWVQDGRPYADIASTDANEWNVARNNNKKVVPHITAGWDKRPRFDNPVSWEPNPIATNWAQTPTSTELVDHIKNALQWTKDNPTVAEINTVLIYAWNEHDEGGWLSPTLEAYDGTARVDAMNAAFGGVAGGSGENTALATIDSERLYIYPNPTDASLFVNGKAPGESWTLIGIDGKRIMTGTSNEINLSGHNTGIYILQIGNESLRILKR